MKKKHKEAVQILMEMLLVERTKEINRLVELIESTHKKIK